MTEPAYYGRPILKPPVWKREIGWYLFTGGLAGASSAMALLARASGNPVLARRAALVATGAVNVSPALLVKDLGRPERFLNMLRVVKPSSPMNVGSWLLLGCGSLTTAGTVLDAAGTMPRTRSALQAAAGIAGVPLSWPTPPTRPGTRPAGSCPSSSPRAPPPARVPPRSSRLRPSTPGRHGVR